MFKPSLFKRPGILLGILCVLLLTIGLAILKLTVFEKAVMMVVCFVGVVIGVLYDMGYFDRYADNQAELDRW